MKLCQKYFYDKSSISNEKKRRCLNSQHFTISPQIFGLTVVYGVFHGLVFLPVLLSSVGPSSAAADPAAESEETASETSNNNTADVVADTKIQGAINPVFTN